ncbi:hypothetical protein [Streptomyces sp. NPDC005953]|uniref:hypothetical protein n=1 Tax=Streptomyces sp. NPDC005953 TaxID=3156719 RepID=UPI0033CA4EC3
MGRVRMTVARVGVLVGGLVSSAGVGLAVDLAGGLIAGGLVFAAWCLFLADVSPGEGGRGRP